jgi:hypothetical protein
VAAVATIGVYGFSGEAFLARLREAGIVMLLDVRQRRGVRDPPGLASLAVEGSFGEWPLKTASTQHHH